MLEQMFDYGVVVFTVAALLWGLIELFFGDGIREKGWKKSLKGAGMFIFFIVSLSFVILVFIMTLGAITYGVVELFN